MTKSPIHRRHHSNLFLLFGGLFFAFLLSRSPLFPVLVHEIGKYTYLGALLSGFLFTSTFTVATGALLLLNFAKNLDPFWLILCAVFGALSGDLLIFRFVRDKVSEDITPVYEHFLTRSHLKKIVHTKYFSWTLPVVGAFIIASPFPDELGISLMGLSTMTLRQFLLISLISHCLGISSLIFAGSLLS